MSGQPENTERIPKRFHWRYRCFGVPETRLRKMEPNEVRLAWIKTGYHLVLFLLFFGLALIAAAAFDHRLSFPAIAIYFILLLYGGVSFYAFWAYLRCAAVRKVITFSIDAEDLVQPSRRNLILSFVLKDSGLPAEFDVWMPSQIAALHSKSPYARFASWAAPIPARIERFAATNPGFIPDKIMTRDDRYELLAKFGQILGIQLAYLLAFLSLMASISRFADNHNVLSPGTWHIGIKVIACYFILRVLQAGYRFLLMALDFIVGRLDSNPGATAYWLRFSKIPWFEHGVPAAWRTEQHLTEFPPTLPRSVTKRIPA